MDTAINNYQFEDNYYDGTVVIVPELVGQINRIEYKSDFILGLKHTHLHSVYCVVLSIHNKSYNATYHTKILNQFVAHPNEPIKWNNPLIFTPDTNLYLHCVDMVTNEVINIDCILYTGFIPLEWRVKNGYQKLLNK